MAIEVLFPNSHSEGRSASPRISFSIDVSQSGAVPVECYILSGNSSSASEFDFDFCVFRERFDRDSSSADELFFDGKILSIQIKKRLAWQGKIQEPVPQSPSPPLLLPTPPSAAKIAAFSERNDPISESKEKQQNYKSPSSFWSFKRSLSLNCPLPLVSRRSSAGSTAASRAKRTSLSNNHQKQNSSKQYTNNHASVPANRQRSPLKKSNHSDNGITIIPALNVSHSNLFGLGSIFTGGKDKVKKKY